MNRRIVQFLSFSFALPQVILLCSAALACGLATPLRADTVEIKGGDRLTGTAVKLEAGKLTFKTSYAADPIVIAFNQVVHLTVAKPMILTTAKETVSVTELAAAGDKLQVKTARGQLPVALAAVKALRTQADQQAYEKSLHPDWAHGWVVTTNANFALAKGNADTESIGAGATATRQTGNDKLAVTYTELYSRNNAANAATANSNDGGVRYDRNLNPRIFDFYSGEFLDNQLQNLDLRSILSSGFGWHARKKERQSVDLYGGLSWTDESYSASSSSTEVLNDFVAANLGETVIGKFGKGGTYTEKIIFYPALSQPGDYQFSVTSGLSLKLTRLLNWNMNLTDNYTSFPPAGTLSNDLVYTTGLGLTFGRK